MATYNTSVPATLDILDKTTPDGTEDSAKLDDAIRQLKSIVMDVLLLEHNSDGSHRSVATSLDANSVTGDKIQSSATDNTKRAIATNHIQDGSITLAKLAALAIDSTKLAANCIDNSKIADNSISGLKIADASITAAKLGPLSIPAAAVAAGSIDTSKLVDAAVTDQKLASGISNSKLKLTTGRIIVGDQNGNATECIVGGNLSVAIDLSTSPPTAVFTASTSPTALIPMFILDEQGLVSYVGGINSWVSRPLPGATLTPTFNNSNLVSVSGADIFIRSKGTYLVSGFCEAKDCGFHVARIVAPDLTGNTSVLFSSQCGVAAGVVAANLTVAFDGTLFVPADNTRYQLQSWVTTAGGTTGGSMAGANSPIISTSRLSFIKIA